MAIKPLIPQPHEALAKAAEHLGDQEQAILALRSLLALDPPDVADVHYRLARQLESEQELDDSRRHVLMALEQAPRYRDALTLLLEIKAQEQAQNQQGPPSPALPAPLPN